MCSITEQVHEAGAVTTTVSASGLSVLAAHVREVSELVAELLRDGGGADLGGLHPDVAAELATTLLSAADRATAAATVLAGNVTAMTGPGTGCLVAGRYASPRRWLESEAGLAPSHAKAVLARARDLREHSGRVEDAWLAGAVSGDTVRHLTSGVTGALKPVPVLAADKARMREEALDLLLPLAEVGTPADVHKAVDRLRFIFNADTIADASRLAAEAYDDQTLTVSVLGPMTRITAWLTNENAAAALTVIDQVARRIADEDRPDDRAVSKGRWSHLMAVAFAETMTTLLDNGQVGSHHGIAPHVTLTADLDSYLAAIAGGNTTAGTLVGELTMPGQDEPVLLPDASIRRILCDADVTRILTTTTVSGQAVVAAEGECTSGTVDAKTAASRVLNASRSVLYVGRASRTATPRQRRALEARDRHCIFPSCRAHPRRCQAHHVVPWEDGGPTDIDDLALLCVAHHHAVHEGGWTMRLRPGATGHEHDCWEFTPP